MKAIIVVDDSRTIRKQMTHFIKAVSEQVEVFAFESGEEALAAMDNISNELVAAFIDYNMEGMTGIELAEQVIKRIPANQVALVTANIQDAVHDKAKALNIGFVEKPMTVDKLKDFLSPLI